MSPHDEEIVDLTFDSSEEDVRARPPKRQRRASPADSGEVQIVEDVPEQRCQRSEQLDDDLEVLGTRGDGEQRQAGCSCILLLWRLSAVRWLFKQLGTASSVQALQCPFALLHRYCCLQHPPPPPALVPPG